MNRFTKMEIIYNAITINFSFKKENFSNKNDIFLNLICDFKTHLLKIHLEFIICFQ